MASLRYALISVSAALTFLTTATAERRGTIIPLYIFPLTANGSDAWAPLKKAYQQYPIETWAIVNCDSGPCGTRSQVYVEAISKLTQLGIKTLGYVHTTYTKEPEVAVRQNITNWKTWYNTTGIFFDEMSYLDNACNVTYYQRLHDFAKLGMGFTKTVGNPGTTTPLCYFDVLDTIMIYESSGFPPKNIYCSPMYKSLKPTQLGIFPYNVQGVGTTAIAEAKKCLGYIYFTNGGNGLEWISFPPYLADLFSALR